MSEIQGMAWVQPLDLSHLIWQFLTLQLTLGRPQGFGPLSISLEVSQGVVLPKLVHLKSSFAASNYCTEATRRQLLDQFHRLSEIVFTHLWTLNSLKLPPSRSVSPTKWTNVCMDLVHGRSPLSNLRFSSKVCEAKNDFF